MTDPRAADLDAALAAQAPALAALDAAIAAAGLAIWIGAEPTYTRRESSDPWWLGASDPLDPGAADKRSRAGAIALALARATPGATARVVLGRQFPDEPAPRFCYAVDAPPGAHPAAATIGALAPDDPDVATLVAGAPGPDRPAPGTLTITPDPGVVEINMAPCADLAAFAAQLAAIDRAAHAAGLAPLRYRYNGDVVDSGGGGQLTLGGPTPADSPFLRTPALLPRLLRYVHNHPALSYWFLGECAGSASQSPRPDEGVRERYDELPLACAELERLAARGALDGATLHAALAPILVDAAGNSHRAELNIEKLWSPHDGRGALGLVEWRAFRMPAAVSSLVAAAALVRAVAARCAVAPYDPAWIDWGAALHDRWALPSELAADLDLVLADLAQHGFDLAPLARDLHAYRGEALARVTVHDGLRLSLHRAVEFWPLVGDVASQERATARLVDPSSERLELIVETDPAAPPPTIVVAGRAVEVPATIAGARHLGVRRRQYVPNPGLHPTIAADEPLVIAVGDDTAAIELRWFAWRPGGGPYPGLPADDGDAAARRAERLQVQITAAPPPFTRRATLAGRTLDVRAWRGEDP